jgi:hypothetical protein
VSQGTTKMKYLVIVTPQYSMLNVIMTHFHYQCCLHLQSGQQMLQSGNSSQDVCPEAGM